MKSTDLDDPSSSLNAKLPSRVEQPCRDGCAVPFFLSVKAS